MKKIFTLLLVCLIIGSFAACKNKPTEQGTTTSSSSQATNATLICVRDGEQTQYPWNYIGTLSIRELSEGLTATTGLDFTLKTAEYDGDSAKVEWAATSSLLDGPPENQKDDFHFFDAPSLQEFMLDSLAATIKHNIPKITDVYYSAPGGDSIYIEGIGQLPVNQPYLGLGRGDNVPDEEGRGDLAPDNGTSEWEGSFGSGEKALVITNDTGDTITYALYHSTTKISEGVATIDTLADSWQAVDGNYTFTLTNNGSQISLFDGDGGQMSGTYTRSN